jgi:phospholipid-binding lipoprotein MlaA
MRPSPLLAALVIAAATLAAAGRAGAAPADPPAGALLEADEAEEDYDPWQAFNEPMFAFNHGVLDRFVVKPAAIGWDTVLPDPVQRGLGRAFDNLVMPRRLVNNLLQLRPLAAGTELARFVVNTTVGVAGLFDVAETALDLEKSDADMGQTLGFYGVGPGPYLVLPFLPPLTVRDGIGRGVDGLLDPIGRFVPFVAGAAVGVVNTVNERSLNLQLFADVEESVFDLYSAVRNGYLQRRQSVIAERRAARRRPDAALTRTAHPAAGGGES